MRVLFLGAPDSPLIAFLERQGESVVSTAEPVSAASLAGAGHEYLISYGFRHILHEDVLSLFPNRAVNLHISLLPWNRGADPNLWSFLEGTPKGVTIHRLDHSIDTGDLLLQRKVDIPRYATLRTSYDLLHEAIRSLFRENWLSLKAGSLPSRPQTGLSSVHRMKDKIAYQAALPLGFDTPVEDIAAYGRALGLGVRRQEAILLLRADADPKTGLGHVMRCLTLGREWTRRGGRAILMTATPAESIRARAASFGISLHEIGSAHPDPADAASLKNVGAADPDAWIVVDGYRFDEKYLSAARATGARVLAIDDGVRLTRYDADLVLDQNLGAESRDYGAPSLLGTRYALLRPEFAERTRVKRDFPPEARTLLISLGGGDTSQIVTETLEALGATAAGLDITVVVGAACPDPRVPSGVRVVRDPDLPALMESADLAILGGGTTSWEAAYMGLPAVYTPSAENQRPIARALAAAGAGLCVEDASALAAAVSGLRRDAGRRAALAANAGALVDGLGACRVRDKMLSFSEQACL